MAVMKFRPIVVDSAMQELTEHGTEEFPMSMDKQQVENEDCSRIPHWHYEIQISVVTRGSVKFRTPVGEFVLREGEGIFINRGILHEIVPMENTGSVYICANFKPELIYGQSSSVIRRDYVDPLIFNYNLQAIPLQTEPWHRDVCALVLELGQINDAQKYGYELEMQIRLCRIWHLLLVHNREELEKATVITFSDKQRMKTLQNFIHKNYMEKLTLAEIAQAARVSRSECCRVFKRVQHTTPMHYLMHYRIVQSIKMLTCTELNISEIAQQAGFSSSSYYTECFKSKMHCTPMEYRKQHGNAVRTDLEKGCGEPGGQ